MNKFEAVTLEITKKCNHNCVFCYNIASETSKNVTFEQIDTVIDKLYKYGIERVTVTGGEPFMVKKETNYLLEKLVEKNFDVCLNTNLTLVDEDEVSTIEKLIGHDNIVYSSIPSVDEKRCDEITKRKGSYQNICRGIELCNKHNVKVGLNMSVSDINIDDLDKIPDFLRKHKVDSFTLFPVIPPLYDRDNKSFENSCDNLKKVADCLLKVSEEFGIVVGSIRPLPRCLIGDDPKYDVIVGSRCTTGNERFSIEMVTGNVEACSQEKHFYGNIYEDSIESCYEKMAAWRNDDFLAPSCKTCDIYEKCGGMCLWSEPCGRC